eukprot:CAMPEP_0179882782 /NCGR_PEP_ID=MMETSP0982-20121206/28338_1 /TAXON_ID=483367 /ORGANISM="non described non described, Strain CCMP 2436" /LENGTH=90 /DNA_ID=CAMNT_0021777133 /DNA_START=82 /DNA_END=355 /DNA_ORIENTATION=+
MISCLAKLRQRAACCFRATRPKASSSSVDRDMGGRVPGRVQARGHGPRQELRALDLEDAAPFVRGALVPPIRLDLDRAHHTRHDRAAIVF